MDYHKLTFDCCYHYFTLLYGLSKVFIFNKKFVRTIIVEKL